MLAVATTALTLAPARFRDRPGWHTGANVVHACVGGSPERCRQATSWASTVPWRDCIECLPHRTVARLPADGIAMQVTVAIEHPLRLEGVVAWPPRIRAGGIAGSFEGLPRNVGVFQRSGRRGPYEISIMVFFGRSRPTERQRAAAEAELRAARLP
jgi:hypothetical protein